MVLTDNSEKGIKIKKTNHALSAFLLSSLAISSSVHAENDTLSGKEVKNFNPETVSIMNIEVSKPLVASNSVAAFAASGAWTDIGLNPTLYNAGQWYYGPLLEAPSGTPSTSTVTNITYQ